MAWIKINIKINIVYWQLSQNIYIIIMFSSKHVMVIGTRGVYTLRRGEGVLVAFFGVCVPPGF